MFKMLCVFTIYVLVCTPANAGLLDDLIDWVFDDDQPPATVSVDCDAMINGDLMADCLIKKNKKASPLLRGFNSTLPMLVDSWVDKPMIIETYNENVTRTEEKKY